MMPSQSYTWRILYLLMVCVTLSYSIPCDVLCGIEGADFASIELNEDGEQDSEKESENEKEEIKDHLPGAWSALMAEEAALPIRFSLEEHFTEIHSEITNPPPES